MARAFDVPRQRVIRQVLIPSLLPFLFAAARYCFALGWKGLVVAEVFGGMDGAGWTIKFWYDAHRAYGVIGYALFFVIFALMFEKFMFDQLSKRLFRWRPSLDGRDVVEQQFDAPTKAAVGAATATGAALGSITLATEGPDDHRRHRRERRQWLTSRSRTCTRTSGLAPTRWWRWRTSTSASAGTPSSRSSGRRAAVSRRC